MIALVFNSISPLWLLFEGLYVAGAIVLFAAASKSKTGWGKAGLSSLGLAILAWRALGVIPSWWLYYADGPLGWGGQGCQQLDAQCGKQTLKDLVVIIENTVVFGGFLAGFWFYQKKFPKQLAPGERKPEATGGYK